MFFESQIILSSGDVIVPTPVVLHYLAEKRKQGFANYEVLTFDGELRVLI